jgi:hypothetical protein
LGESNDFETLSRTTRAIERNVRNGERLVQCAIAGDTTLCGRTRADSVISLALDELGLIALTVKAPIRSHRLDLAPQGLLGPSQALRQQPRIGRSGFGEEFPIYNQALAASAARGNSTSS